MEPIAKKAYPRSNHALFSGCLDFIRQTHPSATENWWRMITVSIIIDYLHGTWHGAESSCICLSWKYRRLKSITPPFVDLFPLVPKKKKRFQCVVTTNTRSKTAKTSRWKCCICVVWSVVLCWTRVFTSLSLHCVSSRLEGIAARNSAQRRVQDPCTPFLVLHNREVISAFGIVTLCLWQIAAWMQQRKLFESAAHVPLVPVELLSGPRIRHSFTSFAQDLGVPAAWVSHWVATIWFTLNLARWNKNDAQTVICKQYAGKTGKNQLPIVQSHSTRQPWSSEQRRQIRLEFGSQPFLSEHHCLGWAQLRNHTMFWTIHAHGVHWGAIWKPVTFWDKGTKSIGADIFSTGKRYHTSRLEKERAHLAKVQWNLDLWRESQSVLNNCKCTTTSDTARQTTRSLDLLKAQHPFGREKNQQNFKVSLTCLSRISSRLWLIYWLQQSTWCFM